MKTSRFHWSLVVSLLACVAGAAAWLMWSDESRDEPLPRARNEPPRTVPRMAERRPLPFGPDQAPAAPRLDEPAPVRGPNWVELNNLAADDLAAGALLQSIEKLERCHAAQPENQVFAGNLAEALIRLAKSEHDRGELTLACEHLSRAIEVAPVREDAAVLEALRERWTRELELAADDWTAGSSRFDLAFDTDRSDIVHHSEDVLAHLELSYDELARWFGADPFQGGPPIRVVLYDPEDFDHLTGLGDWAAGVFDGVVRVSVRDLTQGLSWRAVLVHELVHAFVQALGGQGVPGWLNEGLAQLLENRPDVIPRLRARLLDGELFPLERLAGNLAGWKDTDAIGRAYAESLVFVDFLRRTYGDEALRRMVTGMAQERTAADSFQQWTSVPLELVFQDWCAGLRR